MPVTKTRVIGAVIILAFFVTIFLLNTKQVAALSCAGPQGVFVASYDQGVFIDGFTVYYVGARGGWCSTRPIISHSASLQSLQNIFAVAGQDLKQVPTSGVYQLITPCHDWGDGPQERCGQFSTLEKLSNDFTELALYKTKWQQKERDEWWSTEVRTWLVDAIIIGSTTVAILWPWILMKIWPNLRRRLNWLLIIAILLQAFILVSAMLLSGAMGLHEPRPWQSTADISTNIIILSIVGEIIFLIARKIRLRKSPPNKS